MLLNARYNVYGDAPVDIVSLYKRRLVNFARDGPSPCQKARDTARVHLVLMIKWGLKCISVLET